MDIHKNARLTVHGRERIAECLVRGKDAVPNSISNVLTAQPSHICTAILERIDDTVSNSVSNLLGAWSIVVLTERRRGKHD
jgi:hypothetical protein